ncbi:unnamed protein product [Amoebophrya sp. A25]|nr:unnamed protein product [Amoebophrya sp. A25]|eukprot:GSA25T00023516001.1
MTFSSGMKMSSLPVTRRLRGRLFAVPTWIVGLLACFLVAAQRAISHASSRADAVPSKGEQLRALQTIATLVSNLATLEVPREEESRNEDEDVRQVDAYALAREREDDDLPLTPSMGEADRSIASTTQTNLQQHGQVESSARTRSAISASSTAASSSLSTLSSLISSTLNRNATVILNPTSADNAALATALKVTTLDAFLSQLNVYPRLSQIPSFEAALVAKAKDLATTDPDAAAASLIKLLVNKGWDFSRLLQFTSQAGDVISQLSGMPTTGNVTLKTSPSGLNRYYTSRLNEELLKLKKMIQEAQNNSTAAGQIVNLPGHATGTSLLLPKGIRFESGIMNLSHYVHDLQAEAAFGAYFSTQWQHLLSSARTQSDIAKYYESGMTLSHLLEEYPLWNSSLAYYSAGGAGIAPNTDARRGFTEYMKRAQENEGQSAASSGQGEDDDSLPRRQGIFGEVDLSPNGIWDLLKAFLMREERRSRNSDYTAMRLLTGTSSFEAEGTPAEQRASMCEADLQRWIAAMSYAVKIKEGEMGKNDAATNVTTQNEIDLYRSKAKDITARCSCSNDNAFAVPLAAKCPAECAFTQRLGDSFCYKVCVRPSQCGDFHSLRHYAHPESRECSIPCGSRGDDLIPGCVECDATNSGGRCHRCENGLELTGSGAVCVNRMLLQLEDIQYGAIVLSLLFLVGYMLQLCCRPTVNARTSNFAREFRRCCKPHKVFFSKKLDKFAFFPARVMLLPGPTEVGPAHYYLFAFHRLVIFVSAALAAQLWITRYMVSGQNLFTSQALSDFASFQAAGTHPKYTNGTAVDVNRMCAAVYEKDGIGITPKNGTNATSNGTSTIRSFMEVREYHHHRRKFEDGERGKIHSRSNMLASSFLDEESEASETIDTTLSRRKNARGKRPKRSSSSAETRSRMQEQDHAAWPTRIFTGVADQVLRSLGGIEEKTIAFIKSQMLETKGRRHAIEIGSGMEMGPLILMEDDEVQEKESESSPGAERERAEDADHKNAVRKHEESPENDSINTVDKELQDVAVVSSSRSRKPKRGKSSATEPSLLEQSAKATSLRSPRPRDDNFDEDDAGDEDEDSMFAGDRDDALFLEAEDDAVDEEESSRRSRKSSPRPKSMINGDLNSGDGDHDSDTDSTPSSSSSYLFLMSFFSSSSTLLNLQASATASRHGQGGNNKATTSFRKGTTWLQVVDPSTSPEIEGAQKRLSAREEEALLSFLETGDGDAREQKRQAHEEAMAAGMLGVYVGAIMLTLSYYLSVVRISHFLDSILPSPRQFSLVGSGFPDGVDTEEIRMWLMEWIPGIRLVGVSLRYLPAINFDKHIERAVLQMLKEHCNKKAKRVFDIRAQGPPLSDDEGGHGGDDSSNEDLP